MKAIGPTFAAEIAAAGLSGLPFSWQADGTILFGPTMTADQIAAVGAVYAAHDPTKPDLAEQAGAAISAGCTIALSGSITLAATLFPTDPLTQGKISAVVTTIDTTGTFPGGATTYPMKDAAGTWHTFSVAQYKAVAGAIAAYVAALDLIADGNPLAASSLPADAISLAV
jgi:hypothetical protein